MPAHTARLESRLLATASMGLALAVTAPYRDAAAADICVGGGLTTITTAQAGTDNCTLNAGESVDVQAAGSIPFTGANPAVDVANGVSAGSITNAGTVSVTSAGEEAIVMRTNSSLASGIVNSGTISSTTGHGIDLISSGSIDANGITNDASGTITGGDAGILANNTSSITGGISNSGTITAGDNGIFLDGSSSITSDGIINTSSGDITAVDFGIIISGASTVTGGITNQGDITSTTDDGIGLDGAGTTVAGGITNASGATIDADTDGIVVDNSASVTSGGITNSGTITADDDGIVLEEDATMTGDLTNAGTITAGDIGVLLTSEAVITGSITNTGTITSTGGDGIAITHTATVTGSISNSGTITAGSGDGILISEDSTTGSISNSGTITASDSGIVISESATGSITNSGTIDADAVGIDLDTVTSSGGVSNRGTLKGAIAALRITNPVTQLTIDNAGTLDGDVVLANAQLDLTDDAARVIGNVTGVAGSAVSVEADFTSEGSFNVGTFSVGSDHRLDLAHAVTATTFANSGTVAIGENAVTLTTDYTQASGAGLEIGASSDSSFGRLTVSGSADFSASNALHVVVGNGSSLAASDELLNVVQAGTLTASAVTVTDTSALLAFEGVIDGNTIDLTVASTRSIATIADDAGGNGGGAGGALDDIIADGASGDMQTIIDALNSLGTDQEVDDAVQKMLPAITGGHAQGNVAAAQAGATNVVQDRLIRLSGLNAGDALFADPAAWIKPFAADTAQGSRGGVSGYDGLTVGAAVGIDGRFTEDLRAGLALSYADATIDGRGASDSSIDLDTVQVTAYGTYDIDQKTHLNLIGALGWNENESRRVIDFGGLDRTAEADYDSWHGIADVELVRSYKLWKGLGFMPSLAATYTYARAEDYSETGAGAASLDVDDADADSLTLATAGKLIYETEPGVSVTGNLGLAYDVLAGDDQVAATFEGGGGAFVTESIDPAPFGITAGVSLELVPATGIDASLNYDIEAREDFRSHKVQLNLRIPL